MDEAAGSEREPLGGPPRLGERIRRGWREADACWELLSADPYLLILPTLSLLFVCAAWAGLYFAASAFVGQFYLRFALTAVLAAYPTNFASTYLGVAFVAVADGRLQGRRTTIAQGLAVARRKAGPIARWALIGTGIGLVLQVFQHVKADWALTIAFAWLAGTAWAVLTFFVVPVLAFENVGARDGLRRSGEIVRARWGEGLGGFTNLGLAFGAGMLVVLVFAIGVSGVGFAIGEVAGIACLALAGIALVGFFTVLNAGSRLLALGLYRFATGGPAVGFDQQVLTGAVMPKRRRWPRRR